VPLDANLNAAIENLLTAGPNLLANLRPDPGLQPQNSQRILADLDLDLTTLLAMDINTKDLFSRRPQDDKKRSRSLPSRIITVLISGLRWIVAVHKSSATFKKSPQWQ